MRDAFCKTLLAQASDPSFVFLTGDLGFKALEPLREAMGTRFINAGVAEQNMVSVAAGLARSGLYPWVYSIAPFVYARPFEQIRNDVCLHRLPVRIVGNGGGYAYGVMGATHHALEDYGTLLTLPYLRAFVPAFDSDVEAIIKSFQKLSEPAYLRLGLSELPSGFQLPNYAAWRKLLSGNGPTLLIIGPLAGSILAAVENLSEEKRPNLWLLTELPIVELPIDFLKDLHYSQSLLVIEEHVAQGGLGQIIAEQLLLNRVSLKNFAHLAAHGYVSGKYGSQKFHRIENKLDPESILGFINSLYS